MTTSPVRHAGSAEHVITAEDLWPSTKSKPHATGKVPTKYRDPETGATWTGRGKEPVWIRGLDRDAFLITPAQNSAVCGC